MRYQQLAEKHLDVRLASGDELYCLCPFHRDSKPSFAFNVRKGVFICYACGEKGGIDKLLQQLRVESAPDPTTDDVANSIHHALREEVEQRVYPERWLGQFAMTSRAMTYLNGRGLANDTIYHFQLGYDLSSNAITIPLRSPMGDLLGVNRRFLSDDAPVKYKYQFGFRRNENLYGYSDCPYMSPILAICEGAFDALAFWNVNTPAVAIYGASMSDTQAALVLSLMPKLVLIATDNDKEGRRAALAIEEQLGALRAAVMPFPGRKKDPGSMTPLEVSEAVTRALSGS